MFRQKSLERLHAPDNLDQLLVVVRPRAAFTLGAIGAVLFICLLWCVFARIPMTVDGYGILLKPRSIKMIQASGGGVVTDTTVVVGQDVKAGQVILTVEQTEAARQLEQLVAEYRALTEFHRKGIALAEDRRNLELELIETNLAEIETNLESLKQLQVKFRQQMSDLTDMQTSSLKKTLELLQSLRESQQRQLANVAALVDEGVTSDAQRLSSQAGLTETESRIAEMEVRVKQATISRLDTEQQLLRLGQELAGLEAQRQQLHIQRQKAQQEFETDLHSRTQALTAMASTIRLSKERLYRQSAVRSRYNGRVLEVAASVGQVIGAATRVAILQIEPQTPFFQLELAEDTGRGAFRLVYEGHTTDSLSFDASAPQIEQALRSLAPLASPDATVRVQPGNRGRSFDIFITFDGAAARAADALRVVDTELETVDGMPTFAAVTEVGDLVPQEDLKHLGFLSIGDGKRVQRGMQIRVNPANVERQRYGSMLGRVVDVSTFPVTSEGLLNMIGNREVVEALLQQGGTILVEAEMERDLERGGAFKWTSKGPDMMITAGTTTTCRITVEERRPITFAIPLLRKWFLGEADKPMPGDAIAAR